MLCHTPITPFQCYHSVRGEGPHWLHMNLIRIHARLQELRNLHMDVTLVSSTAVSVGMLVKWPAVQVRTSTRES